MAVGPPERDGRLVRISGEFVGWRRWWRMWVIISAWWRRIRLSFSLTGTPKIDRDCVMPDNCLNFMLIHSFISHFSGAERISVLQVDTHANRLETTILQYKTFKMRLNTALQSICLNQWRMLLCAEVRHVTEYRTLQVLRVQLTPLRTAQENFKLLFSHISHVVNTYWVVNTNIVI